MKPLWFVSMYFSDSLLVAANTFEEAKQVAMDMFNSGEYEPDLDTPDITDPEDFPDTRAWRKHYAREVPYGIEYMTAEEYLQKRDEYLKEQARQKELAELQLKLL
jgi:hypothetical protein